MSSSNLAALGVKLEEEDQLRSGIEATVEVDADPATIAEAAKVRDAQAALLKAEEQFDAACDAMDAPGAPQEGPERLALQRRRAHLEAQVAMGAKNVAKLVATAKANRQARLAAYMQKRNAERAKQEDDKKAELGALGTHAAAAGGGRSGNDGSGAQAGGGGAAAGSMRLLNGAVSAGSSTLLSAKRAQRVLNTHYDRSHVGGGVAPFGAANTAAAARGAARSKRDQAAASEAVLEYRGGDEVHDSALRVSVAHTTRRGARIVVDDGDEARFLARRQEDANAREARRAAKAHRTEGAASAAAAAENEAPEDDIDDDDDPDYIAKLAMRAIREAEGDEANVSSASSDDDDDDDMPDVTVLGDFTVPARVWVNLLDYQQVGLRWLVERHMQRSGGILGDEMGLGKTIQIAAFLATLHNSKKLQRPAVVLAPLTVLQQWVAELRKWVPDLRAVILHSSGSSQLSRQELVRDVAGKPVVVLSTYTTAAVEIERLSAMNPQYVILDEGHKISNPDASITIAVKSFPTPHRLILSGSPIQNTLKELWCLFDFVAPGVLGSVSTFVSEFEDPIKASRNPSASALTVQTAIECARALRDHIAPYMLRRLKRDVNTMLPPKHEKVVRCLLTDKQIQEYLNVLGSQEVRDFKRRVARLRDEVGQMDKNGRLYSTGGLNSHMRYGRGMTEGLARQAFKALTDLRAITNHADLFKVKVDHRAEGGESGYVSFRSNKEVDLTGSGKLQALDVLLEQWKLAGNRVLVFSQTRTALDIIENLVEQRGYMYFRMDGTTPSHHRQPLIDRFNSDPTVFVALLTTRVGGLGVNLVGADRVVIFDPDWNPVTDEQARERAWRIGQTREVCIYRMVTTGTVEEHILHRQLAKLFVAEKVLSDPSLQRSFHLATMQEAFLLGPEYLNRVDPNSRGLVAADSFNVGEEIKRGQATLEAHGNTNPVRDALANEAARRVVAPPPAEPEVAAAAAAASASARAIARLETDGAAAVLAPKPLPAAAAGERNEDAAPPPTRQVFLTADGVFSGRPRRAAGASSRLAALEGDASALAAAEHAGHMSQEVLPGGMKVESMASSTSQMRPPSVKREPSASVAQTAHHHPMIKIEPMPGAATINANQNTQSQQQQQGGGDSSADPNAETNMLQRLMTDHADIDDAAEGVAARLARYAAQRTLHRATSNTTVIRQRDRSASAVVPRSRGRR